MSKYKYVVTKRLEIAGMHHLTLPYESKCTNFHGHNWIIKISVGANTLENDMVIDFAHIKREIHDKLDHKNLNEVFEFNPTAENIAEWISNTVTNMRNDAICFKVEVQESEGNIATYNREVE